MKKAEKYYCDKFNFAYSMWDKKHPHHFDKKMTIRLDLGDIIGMLEEFASEQCQKRDKLLSISHRLIGEIIDNYEADAINLPAEMYNELKFHWKQLKKGLPL